MSAIQLSRRVRAVAAAVLLLAALPRVAAADDLSDALSGLAAPDPKPAIEALLQSDDAKAKAALQALSVGRLFRRTADDAVVIGEKDGEMVAVTNAATGDSEDMAKEGELEPIALDDVAKALLQRGGAAPAEADGDAFTRAVAALNAGSFADKGRAIERLTAPGDPRAVPVLQALNDGRLYTRRAGGGLFVGERSGGALRLVDAATQQDAGTAAAGDVEAVIVNNYLRNVLREALGRLGLASPDPAQRQAAAEALGDGATPAAAALLRDAYARETVASAKAAIARALAAADLNDADKAKRLAAIALLQTTADPRTRSMLEARAAAETDPEVKATLAAAFAGIDRKLAISGWVANLFQGISLGSVLLLAAIGLAITFGVMGVINMAHGEMIMLGAYATYVVQEAFRAWAPPALFDWYLVAAVPVAFAAAGAVGVALERTIIRFLYGRALETLLATWGISLVLQQAVRSVFGAPNKEVANPSWMTGGFTVTGGFDVTWNRLVIIVFCFLVLGLLAFVIRRTSFGLHMRAVTQNRDMARATGINSAWVDALTFGLGSGIAGIAGVALSQIGNVSPNLGTIYIVDSFMVVVFGGVGNLSGTLVAAMGLGIVNKFLEPVAGAVLGKIAVLVVVILFIQRRPRGLFALKGRMAEA